MVVPPVRLSDPAAAASYTCHAVSLPRGPAAAISTVKADRPPAKGSPLPCARGGGSGSEAVRPQSPDGERRLAAGDWIGGGGVKCKKI